MAMNRIGIISDAALKSARRNVETELLKFGFFDDKVSRIPVRLVPFGGAYGWQDYQRSGTISIPRVSWAKLCNLMEHEYVSLRDVLRHEFAHAVADTHQHLIRTPEFALAFGDSHHWATSSEYAPELFVTAYAATATGEDFAETFMYFLKYAGKLPARFSTPAIRKKWRFVRQLGMCMRREAKE